VLEAQESALPAGDPELDATRAWLERTRVRRAAGR
jgi:hypothetical protein